MHKSIVKTSFFGYVATDPWLTSEKYRSSDKIYFLGKVDSNSSSLYFFYFLHIYKVNLELKINTTSLDIVPRTGQEPPHASTLVLSVCFCFPFKKPNFLCILFDEIYNVAMKLKGIKIFKINELVVIV